jgi:hypothetical protein
MQAQLPLRIEYLDQNGVLQSTTLFYGLHDADVMEYLLLAQGCTALRRVRDATDGRLLANPSQYPSPWVRWGNG